MKVHRAIYQAVSEQLTTSGKAVIIYGARQVGKTTLAQDVLSAYAPGEVLSLNADLRGPWWDALTSRELPKIRLLIAGYKALFIDEAQRIPEIGLILKIIVDNFKDLKVVVTGSSSLDLASKVSEPLTGRAYSYYLYPLAQLELARGAAPLELDASLEERLILGSYPEAVTLESREAKITYLQQLTSSYLYKDMLEFGNIRNTSKIYDLLRLLALQIGSQVSVSELATSLKLSSVAVDRYIDLLEKSFIIFRLQGYSRNLRKEMTKMHKIYFYDTGIRNAIIGNFNDLAARDDAGALWENFLIVERMKLREYTKSQARHYFWRLQSGAELDLIEEHGGALAGYEIKFGTKSPKAPLSWCQAYPEASYGVVNRDSWLPFVLESKV